ncbi:hypothetical protein LTR98_011560 [Exophiala xenobiotica]|nr:hypothetical protein LTR98_011560 [Exophiala xenobiotica]
MQLSLLEPSLYHATTALGGLHRWYEFNESASSPAPDPFIFRHYNKAIYHLVHPIKPLAKIVILIACYLFSSIEALYGDYITSLRHVSSGIRLLLNGNDETNPQSYPMAAPSPSSSEGEQIEESLLQHFSRLDLQAATFNPEWDPSMMKSTLICTTTTYFSTLEQARSLLTPLMLQIMAYKRFEGRGKSDDEESSDDTNAKDRLLDYLHQWSIAMEMWLVRNGSSLDHVEVDGSKSLKVLCAAAFIMLSVPVSAEEVTYDKFLPQFQEIVELADSLTMPRTAIDTQPRLDFSHEIGIIPPLYLTGTKCRDPSVRRRALRLLVSSRRKEGVWESQLAAKATERIIACEEDGVSIRQCADLPECRRIRNNWIQTSSNSGRDARVVLTRRPRPDADLEVIVQDILW